MAGEISRGYACARSVVRGEHLDSARMLSQFHGLTMRQPYRRAEGLERLIVDAEKSSARSAWQSRRATPITRGSERRSLRMARAREAGRREEKGLERLHRLFSRPKESGVARGGENSLSPGEGPPVGQCVPYETNPPRQRASLLATRIRRPPPRHAPRFFCTCTIPQVVTNVVAIRRDVSGVEWSSARPDPGSIETHSHRTQRVQFAATRGPCRP